MDSVSQDFLTRWPYRYDQESAPKETLSCYGIRVDKYCIMPDHIHIILVIDADAAGRTQFAPTISRVIKQFKGAITKQIGRPIWQKSFYDHGIRNQQDYDEIRQYTENNPLKYVLKKAPSWCLFSGG